MFIYLIFKQFLKLIVTCVNNQLFINNLVCWTFFIYKGIH